MNRHINVVSTENLDCECPARASSLDELLGVCERHLERRLARQLPRLEDGRVEGGADTLPLLGAQLPTNRAAPRVRISQQGEGVLQEGLVKVYANRFKQGPARAW